MASQFPSEQSESGEFRRQEDAFRERIAPDGSTAFPVVADRYHLYVSLACPWASRTVIARRLLGLEKIVGLTVVDPGATSAAGLFVRATISAATR